MTVLLIHFSDIHLNTSSNSILSRVSSMKNALKDDLAESDDAVLLISEDIAFSGKSIEYDSARQSLSEFEREIKSIKPSIKLNYIVVTGNHDCSFEPELHGDTREQVIRDVNDTKQGFICYGIDISPTAISYGKEKAVNRRADLMCWHPFHILVLSCFQIRLFPTVLHRFTTHLSLPGSVCNLLTQGSPSPSGNTPFFPTSATKLSECLASICGAGVFQHRSRRPSYPGL